MKALNERISEWAYFLNLAKRLRRYLNFSALKMGFFLDKTYILNGTKKKIFDGFFGIFWE